MELRDRGYRAWVVEATIRQFKRDLFNCIDVLAIAPGQTLAVQVTSGDNHAARATKVRANQYLDAMLAAGWIVEVWSYRKNVHGRIMGRRERILGADRTAEVPNEPA
jgi:hypothetical protein